MQVFMFRSEKDSNVIGVTTRRGGGNLPADFALWTVVERIALLPGVTISTIPESGEKILEAIERDGYFVWGRWMQSRS